MKKKSTKKPKKPEKSLLSKAMNLVDKSDDFLEDKVKQVRKSKTFKKVTGKLKNLEDYVEDKMDDIDKSKAMKKLEKVVDKVGVKAESSYSKLKKLGKDLAGKPKPKPKPKAKPKPKPKPKAPKTPLKPVKSAAKPVKSKVQTSPVRRKTIAGRGKSK